MISGFRFVRTPTIVFGAGKFEEVPRMIGDMGKTALVVTGGGSYRASGRWERFIESLKSNGIRHYHVEVSGEPTPEVVDAAAAEFRGKGIDVVMGWGGGSVVDVGKAVSAMLPQGVSVFDFLENVGAGAEHNGVKAPFIAVPTTSGTGSEATKNAVLRRVGAEGFKNSLRHDNLVPDVAVIDPELMVSCPAPVTAACGMDAFTQLLESYVSTQASMMTDALAFSGLECVARSLVRVCTDGAGDVGARGDMAYAALMSGITLANAGLGVVHGFAGPIGGFFDIPHGVVCGTLVGAATEATIKKLMKNHGDNHIALRKYARVGALLCGNGEKDTAKGCAMLVERIGEWTEELKIPRLGAYGIGEGDLDKIVAVLGNKCNPVELDVEEMREVLGRRL